MTEFTSNTPFNELDIDIMQDADWNDAFEILEADDTPLDLTSLTLELYIRPAYDHTTLFKKLTSVASAGIVIDVAGEGLAHFFLDRAVILSDIPIGEWKQFLVLTEGTTQTELWRGDMRVHPGIIAP